MGIENSGLTIYLASGIGGGFSPSRVLVAASSAAEAYRVAQEQSQFFLIIILVPLAAVIGADLKPAEYEGEWEEPIFYPDGPRVLAEYYK